MDGFTKLTGGNRRRRHVTTLESQIMNYELNHSAAGGIERAVEDVAAVGLELQVDFDDVGRDIDSVQRRGHGVVERDIVRRHRQGVGHKPRGRELNGEHAGVAIEPALGLHLGKPVGPTTTTKDNNLTTLITVRAVVGIYRQTYPQQEDADDCNFFFIFNQVFNVNNTLNFELAHSLS